MKYFIALILLIDSIIILLRSNRFYKDKELFLQEYSKSYFDITLWIGLLIGLFLFIIFLLFLQI